MSVLIKGMEMPKKAYKDIHGTLWSNGRFTFTYLNNTISDYKVVEVPTPHGRLIDADALLMDANKLRYGEGWLITVENIEAAPTVIEAEENEND